jgi:hypothetical protein
VSGVPPAPRGAWPLGQGKSTVVPSSAQRRIAQTLAEIARRALASREARHPSGGGQGDFLMPLQSLRPRPLRPTRFP